MLGKMDPEDLIPKHILIELLGLKGKKNNPYTFFTETLIMARKSDFQCTFDTKARIRFNNILRK